MALVLILLAAAATAVFAITVKPESKSTSAVVPPRMSTQNLSSGVDAALSDYELNAANTDNVYQQQVVAAWGAKDLLTVIGRQNATLIDNQVAAAEAENAAQSAVIQNQASALAAQERTQVLMSALIIVGVLLVGALAVVGVTLRDRAQPTEPTQAVAAEFPAQPEGPEQVL